MDRHYWVVRSSGHDRTCVSWSVRPTPRVSCFFTEFGGGHFDDIRCVRRKTFRMFEERHSLCLKKDTPCVRRGNSLCSKRTLLVFEEGHSLCAQKNIPCVQRKTLLVFEEGHSLCSKKDNASFVRSFVRVFVRSFVVRLFVRLVATRVRHLHVSCH